VSVDGRRPQGSRYQLGRVDGRALDRSEVSSDVECRAAINGRRRRRRRRQSSQLVALTVDCSVAHLSHLRFTLHTHRYTLHTLNYTVITSPVQSTAMSMCFCLFVCLSVCVLA